MKITGLRELKGGGSDQDGMAPVTVFLTVYEFSEFTKRSEFKLFMVEFE